MKKHSTVNNTNSASHTCKLELGQQISSIICSTLPDPDCQDISTTTGFPKNRVKKLHLRFSILDKDSKNYLVRNDLLAIPEFAVNPLAERIVDLFIPPQNEDAICTFSRFCQVLAHFQPTTSNTKEDDLNSARNKAKLVFEVFDKDYSGKVAKDEILEILRFMVGGNIDEGQLDLISKRVIYESVRNLDGKEVPELDLSDFMQAMNLDTIESKMTVRFQD